jgi:hypothetical protein
MRDGAVFAIQDEQARSVARFYRFLGNIFRREIVIEIGGFQIIY